ncbi:hypothetical protein D3C87_1766160 [compost metagenome]
MVLFKLHYPLGIGTIVAAHYKQVRLPCRICRRRRGGYRVRQVGNAFPGFRRRIIDKAFFQIGAPDRTGTIAQFYAAEQEETAILHTGARRTGDGQHPAISGD